MNARLFIITLIAISIAGCQPKNDMQRDNSAPEMLVRRVDHREQKAFASAKTREPDAGDQNGVAKQGDSGHSIVGQWTCDDPAVKTSTFDFKRGGILAVTNPLPDPKGALFEIDGTYKIDGNRLFLHTVSAKETAPADADEATKKKVAEATKGMASSISSSDESDVIEWVDKDTFTVSKPGGTKATYKRKA